MRRLNAARTPYPDRHVRSYADIRRIGGHAAEAIEEHEAIFRAIRDGRPEAAADATVVHLNNTLKDHRREIQRRAFGGNRT